MSEPENKKKKGFDRQTIPIYAVGVTWLIYALRHGLDSMRKLITCAILSALAFLIFKGIFRDRTAEADTTSAKKPEQQTASTVKRTQKKSSVERTKYAQPPSDPEPAPAPEPNPAPDPEPEKKGKYDALLDKLTEMDEQIPDIQVSAKLKQMRELARLIFRTVEQQPEKEPKIRRLTEYYLPTTIRLLEHYVQMQDLQAGGENVRDGMEKISSLLDSMIVALQRQLDGLFQSDVVDITADIRVMEQRLAAEGLTEQEDF